MLGKRYENNGKATLKLNAIQKKVKRKIDLKVRQKIYQFESVLCGICNNNEFEKLAKKDRYGLYMPVVICKRCGLIQTNPRMTQDSYNRFYNEEYRSLYVGERTPTQEFFLYEYQKGKRIYSFLERTKILNKVSSNPFVLEVGCGAGGILHYFKKKLCRVQGIDIGKEYIEYGKEKFGLDLVVGTLSEVVFDKSPDIVIYSDVIEHILFPKEELKRIKGILSDRGVLYIELPGVKNLYNSYTSYSRDFLRFLQNAHIYHFTLTTLNNLLKIGGFQLILGDETIKSIFKKSETKDLDLKFKNDYNAVMKFLYSLEKFRRLYKFQKFFQNLKNFLTKSKTKDLKQIVKSIRSTI
ncbi:MAG: class I SAM-dependent methyltransferase [Candidatus Helarchaeota archaeon]|nr:class I SAM-dependent methyltransferase [Candidatus Helarchaeota archaeon]